MWRRGLAKSGWFPGCLPGWIMTRRHVPPKGRVLRRTVCMHVNEAGTVSPVSIHDSRAGCCRRAIWRRASAAASAYVYHQQPLVSELGLLLTSISIRSPSLLPCSITTLLRATHRTKRSWGFETDTRWQMRARVKKANTTLLSCGTRGLGRRWAGDSELRDCSMAWLSRPLGALYQHNRLVPEPPRLSTVGAIVRR